MSVIPALGRQKQADLLSSEPTWSTEQVSGQPGLHREILSQKIKKEKEKETVFLNPVFGSRGGEDGRN